MNITFVLSFLSELKTNNNREWFEKNKDRYIQANTFFLDLVQIVIQEIGQFDPDITYLEPKKCAYRIYRDIRFSKDKTPYKTHFGAEMTLGGRKSGLAGYYFHIQPGESMVAGGVWHPSTENLAKIRQEIDYNSKELKNIIEGRVFKEMFGEIKGDKLKKAPKGYNPDQENIELIKFKDFLAYRVFDDDLVKSSKFLKVLIEHFKVLQPFNNFLNVAVA